jgi:hypothetical protein
MIDPKPKIKPKIQKFLQLRAEGLSLAKAYLGSGYKAATENAAAVAAHKLLKIINESMHYRDIIASYIPKTHIFEHVNDLMDSNDERVSVTATQLASKISGMLEPDIGAGQGQSIIIVQQRVDPDVIDTEESPTKSITSKPLQLKE